MFWTSHNDIEKTREWIAFELGQIEKQDWYRFAIVLKDTNTLIGTALSRFEKKGIEIPEKEYLYSILLANPDNAYTIMNEGYCGDGGIPGYIMAWLVLGEETIRRLPAALVHETNHNVRYQFIKWTNDITLGEMLVSEGLAENYATTVFGEEFLGPWVTKTDNELFQLIFRELEFPLKDIRRMLDRQVKKPDENPSVGLILCASKNDEVVEYAMSRTMSPMMVLQYQLQLPDKEVLRKKLQELANISQIEDEGKNED